MIHCNLNCQANRPMVRHLGCGGDLVVTSRPRTRSPSAGLRCRLFVGNDGRRAVGADRRRQHIGDAAVSVHPSRSFGAFAVVGTAIIARVARAVTPSRTLTAFSTRTTIGTVAPILPLTAIIRLALASILPIVTTGSLVAFRPLVIAVTGFEHLVVAAVLVIEFVVARTALILEPRAGLAQNAEIVIRILQVIFCLHAVARELRVARHALVFFEQLGRVAALAVVLPVTGLAAEVLASRSATTTTAPAAVLTIIDQMPPSLRSVSLPLPHRRTGQRS